MKTRIAIVLCLLSFIGLAHADDNTLVAILRYGGTDGETTYSEYGVLEMLQAAGLINAEEREQLDTRSDVDGEHISIFWGDAAWDLANANLMVDDALGRGADVLITLTTPVTRTAINATADMDEPPGILFASVFNPAEAGIAQSACEKPDHVSGSVIQAPYERLLSLLQTQNPELSGIGVLFSSGEITGSSGADEIAALAEDLGISVSEAAVNNLADFPVAAQSLADSDVDAIVAPIDAVTAQALPVIAGIANESGIPVVYPVLGAVYHGTTFGVGIRSHYDQGLNLGRLLTAYLAGDLDLAATGLSVYTGESHSVNLDAAAAQDISISQELIDTADIVIQDGQASQSADFVAAYESRSMEDLQSDEAQAEAADFIASLQCGE